LGLDHVVKSRRQLAEVQPKLHRLDAALEPDEICRCALAY
jgi:hypothetical protein